MINKTGSTLLLCFVTLFSFGQSIDDLKNLGEIHGNFDISSQYYFEDETIGTEEFPQEIGSNAYLNLVFTKGKFEAGLRYESYQPRLLGFNENYDGNGIPYRYAKYKSGELEITVGNFYEQFGNGQIFRSYFEPGLGVDNSVDGLRVIYNLKGITFKGLMGQQRFYFDKGPGIVRAGDVEASLNDLIKSFSESKTKISIGGSAVSKYQKDENVNLVIPENVFAYGGRFQLNHGGFNLGSEYTYKTNDPNARNNYTYNVGQALTVNTGYSKRGFGLGLSAHTLDNMFFRSDRNNTSLFSELDMNYIPALTKQHSYNLLATLYPYATQPAGEFAYQADIFYKFKKGTPLGGKYGTGITINVSQARGLNNDTIISDPNMINDSIINLSPGRKLYTADLFDFGDDLYWQDINIQITKKLSKKLKMKIMYQNLIYNKEVLEGKKPKIVYANTGIVDVLYKFNRKHALRTEVQAMFTEQDKGDWATLLFEYTYSPHWFVSVMDQYNYGNENEDERIHYPFGTVGYIKGGNRISISYGRQRAGIFCIGGVCRTVPASHAISLAITSTF